MVTAGSSSVGLEDLKSVGTRINWGAILAGVAISLGISFLLGILGAAVGLSISDRMNPSTLTNAAIIWAIATTCVALFVGGVVTSVITVGENKVEAMMYGVIMWAVLLALFVGLGAAGVSTGFNTMADLSNRARTGTAPTWETTAAEAGVPAEQIEKWRTMRGTEPGGKSAPAATVSADTVTRLTWYSFFGVWLSMMTAAMGALVGSGPTFRLARFYSTGRTGTTAMPVYQH